MRQIPAILFTTALVAGFGAAAPAAADCIAGLDGGTPTLTCTGASGANANNGTAGLAITVEGGATVTASGNGNNTRPFTLSGPDQSLDNAGVIENTNPANNADAIRVLGDGLSVVNSGTIIGGDRGIHQTAGSQGFSLVNTADGVIRSRRQAVRTDSDAFGILGTSVVNFGLIESQNGRAVQARGTGSSVINHGTMIGGEEVIEGRVDFTLMNYGTIRIGDPATTRDEDGVQFSSGEAHNWGTILATDDGIDIDEGYVHNYATGVIRSDGFENGRDSGGIDADAFFQIEGNDAARPAGALTIVNEGLIEGPRAITSDIERTGAMHITNSGTLIGDGIAIDMAPGMTDSSLSILGESRIVGDVIFGGGDDLLTIGALTSGTFIEGIFDGGAGENTVVLAGYALSAIKAFDLLGDTVSLTLATLSGNVSASFANFGFWEVEGRRYSAADLAEVAPIPLPAALPLLLTALLGLGILRRRRTA